MLLIPSKRSIQCYFDELVAELEKNDFKVGCLLGNLMGEIGDTSLVEKTAPFKTSLISRSIGIMFVAWGLWLFHIQ